MVVLQTLKMIRYTSRLVAATAPRGSDTAQRFSALEKSIGVSRKVSSCTPGSVQLTIIQLGSQLFFTPCSLCAKYANQAVLTVLLCSGIPPWQVRKLVVRPRLQLLCPRSQQPMRKVCTLAVSMKYTPIMQVPARY
jgi:hypothetical protein